MDSIIDKINDTNRMITAKSKTTAVAYLRRTCAEDRGDEVLAAAEAKNFNKELDHLLDLLDKATLLEKEYISSLADATLPSIDTIKTIIDGDTVYSLASIKTHGEIFGVTRNANNEVGIMYRLPNCTSVLNLHGEIVDGELRVSGKEYIDGTGKTVAEMIRAFNGTPIRSRRIIAFNKVA